MTPAQKMAAALRDLTSAEPGALDEVRVLGEAHAELKDVAERVLELVRRSVHEDVIIADELENEIAALRRRKEGAS